MKTSLICLIRLIVFAALGLNIVAIGLGRMFPDAPRMRELTPVSLVYVHRMAATNMKPGTYFFDSRTGDMSRLDLPEGDMLEMASRAPWQDENGQSQVVGRWTKYTGKLEDKIIDGCGLARYRYPDGEPLDYVESNVLPSCPPCWYPGTEERILFPAGDGHLYQMSFHEDHEGVSLFSSKDRQPQPLLWRCPELEEDRYFITSLTWPEDPRFQNTVIASLNVKRTQMGKNYYGETQIWWLRLAPDGMAVVAAGRVTPRRDDDPLVLEQYPVTRTLPDGNMLLAYLTRGLEANEWQVQVAPLHCDPDGHALRVLAEEIRTPSTTISPQPPIFSLDGRWMHLVNPQPHDHPLVRRLPLSRDSEADPALPARLARRSERDGRAQPRTF